MSEIEAPESSIISTSLPPTTPLMTVALVRVAATIVFWGLTVLRGVHAPPGTPLSRFPLDNPWPSGPAAYM